ncbi:hypothetical protein Ahy_B09g095107 [Arachis hypogaea]|uniref:RNase H type-1 domain-containing protein n=1 Tax=Arachis hypogaea TaxID=3818 RepID=A0A444XD32_ARAHY|nr:hypothetical protein Ahy_B09g095107 [Arachis hypogaea]
MTMKQNTIPKLSKPVKEKKVDEGVEIVVMNFDTRETNKRAEAPPGKPSNDGKVSNGEDDVGAGHVRFEQVFGLSETSIDCVTVWILYLHSFLYFLMNLISWNYRGTGGRMFPVLIKDLEKEYDIGMLILLETHVSGDRGRDIQNKLSFDSRYYEEVKVAIKNSGTGFITTVYGSPQKINKNPLDNLRALSAAPEAILTNTERRRRHLSNGPYCPRCKEKEENVINVLKNCQFAKMIWNHLSQQDYVKNFFNEKLELGVGTPNCLVPPLEHYTKLNVDGSNFNNVNGVAYGGILRNYLSRLIKSFSCNLKSCTIIHAEFWGIIKGLQIAVANGYQKR